MAALAIISPPAVGADKPFASLDLRQVKLGGEIGRRVDVTIQNNLL
jgi:hypothetical protein